MSHLDLTIAFVGMIMGLPMLSFALVVLLVVSIFLKVPRRGIAYVAFLLAGLAVAKLQYMIFVYKSGEVVAFQMLATILYVAISACTGVVAALPYIRKDRGILLVVLMTALLGVLQAASMLGFLPYQILNVYASAYALVCVALPTIQAISHTSTLP